MLDEREEMEWTHEANGMDAGGKRKGPNPKPGVEAPYLIPTSWNHYFGMRYLEEDRPNGRLCGAGHSEDSGRLVVAQRPRSTVPGKVRGKVVRSESGLGSTRIVATPPRTATSEQATETVEQWLRFLRSVTKCCGMDEIHAVLDCYG
jgi:hypothetical protein